MSEPTPPKIEFPCEYFIKVIGDAAPDFQDFVFEVVRSHAPDLQPENVSVKASSGGRFTSVHLSFIATGEPQLQAMFVELKASGRVHMVL